MGQKLARSLNVDFIDLDQRITESIGMEIATIFKEKGEDHFRQVERDVLLALPYEGIHVVALGGGSPCSEDNWDFIQRTGMSIYIKVPEDVLFGRLREQKEKRPLTADRTDEALRSYINKTLSDREEFYNRAEFIYEKDKTSWSFLINQIDLYIK